MSGLTVPLGYSFGGAAPAQYGFGKPLLGQGWGADGSASPIASTPSLGMDWLQELNSVKMPELATAEKPGINWFGSKNVDGTAEMGIAAPLLGGLSGAFNAWMGMKQYGLAKQQLAEGKRQFALNYDAQRATTNANMEDRQRSMIASNGGLAGSNYRSVGDYMATNGIKPR